MHTQTNPCRFPRHYADAGGWLCVHADVEDRH